MAAELRITPEWYGKILSAKEAGSGDIGLRLDELLRRKKIEPSSIYEQTDSAIGALHEPPSIYAAGDTTGKIRQHIEQLITLAAGDPHRLGWLLEQMKSHLAPPEHWEFEDEPGIHDKVLKSVLADERKKDRQATRQSKLPTTQGGAGR